ncbi:MAG: hypothetical protein ACOYN4_00535 [Bacteroidales bacterium]
MNTITVSQIFEANQVLSLAIAKTLIGKTIAITNAEYRANRADVRTFKLTGIETEFPVTSSKKRLTLTYEGDRPYATCEIGNGFFNEDTFFGSDADREIYFIEVK